MANCSCGGKLIRVHRTLGQKFVYMAVYRCRSCNALIYRPRLYMFYFAKETCCPLCGTKRLSRLAEPDGIDRMYWNLFSFLRRFVETRIYHCRFCRIQFYDRPRGRKTEAAAPA